MELFRTPVALRHEPCLTHGGAFVSLGSCFAEGIGERLLRYKWEGLANPFGTLFHPQAIFHHLRPDAELDPALFLAKHERVFHFHLPKTFLAKTEAELIARWRETRDRAHDALARPGSFLLLTLGTSFLFEKEGTWVANCHQEPGKYFEKKLSSLESMLAAWQDLLPRIPASTQIFVTVSPVRHLKEGLEENALSKSLLRVLADGMVRSAPGRVRYFPAYEIMVDELRDYRFYARDMLHPTEEAIDYIWDRFGEAYLTPSARAFVAEWQGILNRLRHRPLVRGTKEHRSFLNKLEQDLKRYTSLGIDAELAELAKK